MISNEPNTALYAYFGEIGFFNENIPGHSFYQIGLLDSIAETYKIDKFYFYNYLDDKTPNDDLNPLRPKYPDGIFGQIFTYHTDRLIEGYRMGYDHVIMLIKNKAFSKLFLKARFRNLATLEKKLKDALRFETIISTALNSGYTPNDIYIIDTDLSMSESVLQKLYDLKIKVIVPSVDFPGIGKNFLGSIMDVHEKTTMKKQNHIMYYGNLSFENYKAGHEKNPIAKEIISRIHELKMFDGSQYTMTVAAKETPAMTEWIQGMNNVSFIPRTNREAIWTMMTSSNVCLNVSKDLYLEKNFIPARVYESVICGVVPVSYMKSLHPAMAFQTVDDFFEICRFMAECSPRDYFKILQQTASSF